MIYDIAVHVDHRRRGVARLLMLQLRRMASDAGIHDLFVPAENDDAHALEFFQALGGIASPVTFFAFGRPER